MAAQRIYIITPRIAEADKPMPKRLVRAPNAAQALRHVANEFNVTLASQDDIFAAATEGVKVEDSTATAPEGGTAP
jgi:hypothetical protein